MVLCFFKIGHRDKTQWDKIQILDPRENSKQLDTELWLAKKAEVLGS